jgi:hypothetical protein
MNSAMPLSAGKWRIKRWIANLPVIAESLTPLSYEQEGRMKTAIGALIFGAVVIVSGVASAQGMLLDFAADNVIHKYQTSTCEQLKEQKGEAKSDKEKMAIDFLRNDAQARMTFLDKIAAPVANKLFECGMIP